VKNTPQGWPRISSALYYEDPARAIEWLCKAFGFELRLKVEGEGGRIEHSELTYGEGVIMVAGEKPEKPEFGYIKPPGKAGGANTQNLMVYVDDIDAHFAQARAAGATIDSEPKTHDYGDEYWADRSYGAQDIGGHHWWFSQRVRTGGK